MVDFLTIVKYLVIFIIGYAVIGDFLYFVLNVGYSVKVLSGIALIVVVMLYEAAKEDRARRLPRSHVHVYRR
jgi:hypothetical protein